MEMFEFEKELKGICAINGYEIALEYSGLWTITVYDKETGKKLASTGSTALYPVLEVLKMSFDKAPWV